METHLPIAAVEEGEMERPGAKTVGRQPMALLVGDEPAAARSMAGILPQCGFTVMTVPDEKAALEIAALIPPDLLIAHVAAPGINWLALAIAMRDAVPDCHVLLLSEPVWPVELVDSSWQVGRNFVCVA
jgi:CheY-like chemotaxis protein